MLHYDTCSDGNLFEFVIVSLDNKQWQFTAQSAEVRPYYRVLNCSENLALAL